MTAAPAAARCSAIAAPIPLDAPVTIATLSLSVLIVGFLSHSSAIERPEKLTLPFWIAAPRSEIPTPRPISRRGSQMATAGLALHDTGLDLELVSRYGRRPSRRGR